MFRQCWWRCHWVSAICVAVWLFGVGCVAGCWCPGSRGDHGRLEAGLSQGAPPARSAHRLRAEAWHTAPRAALGYHTPPLHAFNLVSLSYHPHYLTRMLRAVIRVREDELSDSIALKRLASKENAMLGRCGCRTPRCVRRDRMMSRCVVSRQHRDFRTELGLCCRAACPGMTCRAEVMVMLRSRMRSERTRLELRHRGQCPLG